MRKRKDIEVDSKNVYASLDVLILEVLLDIRSLLEKQVPKRKYIKRS